LNMEERLQVIKPAVRDLRAYSLSPHRASVKINQNENPWDAPSRIKEETWRRFTARKWSRYPDFVPASLHERLADFAGWKSDGIIAGNGSNELIQALLMVTIGEGKDVLISEPTFALYRQVATVLGGEVHAVSMTGTLEYDSTALQNIVEEKQPDVTIICSPNNPTGCVIDEDVLVKLLRSSRGLVVVDEAYHEFAGHSVVPLLGEHANLIVLHTFSKAMAFAALRVGYLMAAPQLVSEIRKAVLPYNLNAFSQLAAEVAVEMYEAELRPLVSKIVEERDRLFVELKKIDGLSPVSSKANFMVVRSEIEPKRIFDELMKRDILVRDVSGYPMLRDYFRVSVGTPEENDLLLDALRDICTTTMPFKEVDQKIKYDRQKG
jgi:histidinol-phosphate aminotransferase